MMQLFTAKRLSISTRLSVNFSIDPENFVSMPDSLFKKNPVKPTEVAAMAPPAESNSDNGTSIEAASN
jgi:hypothetical protein